MIESRFFREDCYIDGKWVGGPKRIAVINPASGEIIGSVPNLDRKDTDKAIDAAHDEFLLWREKTAIERADFCQRFYQALMDNQAELARILTIEMGKPLREAMGEVAYAASFFRWFAEEARRIYGDVIPSPWGDKRIIVTKEPVGVVGAITHGIFQRR